MTPDWNALVDSALKLWNTMGWQALVGAALVLLVWKLIDAWGKKPK